MYRLYAIAELKRCAQETYFYNTLAVAWPEIQARTTELKAAVLEQITLLNF